MYTKRNIHYTPLISDLALTALSPQRASDAALAALREAILDGRLRPGQRLKEAEVARRLRTSRTPIRHAFAVLESEGLIEVLSHVGARVRAYDREHLEELYEVRAALEGLAARRACRRGDEDTIAALNASCERFERLRFHEDLHAAVEENRRFHGLIVEASGSDRLRQLLENVTAVPLMYQTALWADEGNERRSRQAHRDITRAIADRDADRAEQLMREHLLAGRDVVTGHVVAPERPGGQTMAAADEEVQP